MNWILDLVFFLILILGTAYGAYRGFVAGVCKLASSFFAIVFAFTFCVAFSNFLELCFHMTSAITGGLTGAISNNAAYDVPFATEVAGADLEAALTNFEINGVARWFIVISFRSVDVIPAGTTPAVLISSVLAKWISIVISFVALILLIKLGALLITKLFGALKINFAPLRVVDQALGAILGLLKACVLIFILLLLVNWLPITSIHDFVAGSGVVGAIFKADWFQAATSYAISGQWFHDYIMGFLA